MKKFNVLMKDPLMSMAKSSLLSLPTPLSISLLWNMGFMVGMTLTLQIATGLVLSMNFVAATDMAFESVIHIMRDIDSGWVTRYLHTNGASLFFVLLYSHLMRGVYFGSPMKLPMVWVSGVVMLLAFMAAAFLGYVLPWGQMSFWGATVITSMLSAIPYIGGDITQWIWGNFSVSQPTLNRFFSLHFFVPLVGVALVGVHLILLHQTGSSNPTGSNTNYDKMSFFPYFLVKDTAPLVVAATVLVALVSLEPNLLGDVENFNPASATTTPPHIQPEWYFLFAYAILRAIPSKLGGVVAMLASILVVLVLTVKKSAISKKFEPSKKMLFWCLVWVAVLLTWVGANPVEPPYVSVGQALTVAYFSLVLCA